MRTRASVVKVQGSIDPICAEQNTTGRMVALLHHIHADMRCEMWMARRGVRFGVSSAGRQRCAGLHSEGMLARASMRWDKCVRETQRAPSPCSMRRPDSPRERDSLLGPKHCRCCRCDRAASASHPCR